MFEGNHWREADKVAALETELADLRQAVDHHRIELLSSQKRWPNYDGHVVQIVSCDKALWTAAGIEPDAPYEDHPLERLHALTDRFRARIDEARWVIGHSEPDDYEARERSRRWLMEMP